MHYFPKELSCMNLAGEESMQLQRSMLAASPAMLVSTPSRVLPHLDAHTIALPALDFFVIDEADLILSFGYAADLERLVQSHIPKTVQTFLMSATLPAEIEQLRKLVLRNPVTLKLQDTAAEPARLEQYVIRCEHDDKFLLMYVTLKLKLLKGKLIVFCNDVEQCFRLRLFLDQFGIKTCVLNPELPATSRHHIVAEFNRGVYDIIIASDASNAGSSQEGRKRPRIKSDREAGAARGVDFKHVDVVVNFDLPARVDSYVHRVGRTARGHQLGTAISLICSAEEEKMLAAIVAAQEASGNTISPHDFDLKQLEGFRYRCNDALRSTTKSAIKSARLRAVKDEMVKSEKLKSFFAERPKDLDLLLRHDTTASAIKPRPHLKHVPAYLFAATTAAPGAEGVATRSHDATTHAPLGSLPQAKRQPARPKFTRHAGGRHKQGKDPLKGIKCKK